MKTTYFQTAIEYYLNNTHNGKMIKRSCVSEELENMHTNIKNLYQSAPSDLKAVILSTVSNIYSVKELELLGYKVTYRHYNESLKVKTTELCRNNKRKYKENIECKEIATEYLLKNSSSSTVTTSKGEPVGYLKKSKKQIYTDIKKDKPEIKMDKSKFYQICLKRYRKPRKKQICARYASKATS